MFESYRDYYNFSSSVLSETRYIHSEKTNNFLATLLKTSSDKTIEISKDFTFYRAQKGCLEEENGGQLFILPFTADRMLPAANKVKNGRVNTIGIPVLYVSDDEDTAVSETRPWIKQEISISKLRLQKSLKILDLSIIKHKNSLYFEEPTNDKVIVDQVWSDIGYAFSRPVNNEDQDIDYIPTQIIGEYFKQNGYDGIKYKSLLAKGNNFALFDITCMHFEVGVVVEVEKLNIETKQSWNIVKYINNGNNLQYNYIAGFKPMDDIKE